MLTNQTLFALVIFAIVSSITPGPNNIMLLASGVNFGFKRTIPHMLGICFGFFVLCIAVGLGIGTLLQAFPKFHFILKIISALYLVYLGLRIALSRSMANDPDSTAKPMTFLQASLFQWVNPKAWMMAISAMLMFSSTESPLMSMLLISVVFAIVNLPCVSIWAVFGVMLKQVLSHPTYLKWFNIFMGSLLIMSIYPIFQS
jgi:threonine/homoserine/homoserine lactone efflux protein